MRQIKFRGKRIDEPHYWITGGYIEWTDAKGYKWNQIVFSNGHHNDVIPETVGQFTGLLDSNGTEIYEGDIIKFCVSGDEIVRAVEWDIPTNTYWLGDDFFWRRRIQNTTDFMITKFHVKGIFKIIGNKFDNPELLKTECDE